LKKGHRGAVTWIWTGANRFVGLARIGAEKERSVRTTSAESVHPQRVRVRNSRKPSRRMEVVTTGRNWRKTKMADNKLTVVARIKAKYWFS
jgi:hypothetical protein